MTSTIDKRRIDWKSCSIADVCQYRYRCCFCFCIQKDNWPLTKFINDLNIARIMLDCFSKGFSFLHFLAGLFNQSFQLGGNQLNFVFCFDQMYQLLCQLIEYSLQSIFLLLVPLSSMFLYSSYTYINWYLFVSQENSSSQMANAKEK